MPKYSAKTVLKKLNEIHKKLLEINSEDFAQASVWHALDKIATQLDGILKDGDDDYGNEQEISRRCPKYVQPKYPNIADIFEAQDEYKKQQERNQQDYIYGKWKFLDSSLKEYIDKFELLSEEQINNEKRAKHYYINLGPNKATEFVNSKKAWLLTLTIPIVFTIVYQDSLRTSLFPSEPKVFVDINSQDGIIANDGPELEYRARTVPPSGTFPETFYVTIMNRGNADARNFSIHIIISPHTNDWFNPSKVVVVSSSLPPVCKAKSDECSMDILPAGESVRLDYEVTLKPSDYNLVKSQDPTVIFEYDYEGLQDPEQIIVKIRIPLD